VSDTPRTESFNCYDNGCDNPLHAWGAFSAELERELNAANYRIKRLEQALDTLTLVVGLTPIRGNLAALQEAMDQSRAVLKAKEDKP